MTTICPRCKHKNTTDNQEECPACGIYYKKYKERLNKAFKLTIINIGGKGLEHAREEFEKLANDFPNIKALCASYINAIELALREHSKANHKTSQKIFRSLLDKQPDLYGAISPYLIKQEQHSESADVPPPKQDPDPEQAKANPKTEKPEGETKINSNLIECPACNKMVSINANTCPHCGEPLKTPASAIAFADIDGLSKIIGILGIAIVSIGVFCPIISAPIVGSINYFKNGEGDGTILLIIAGISLLLIYLDRAKYLTHTGAINLLILGYTFYVFTQKKSEMKASFESNLAGNPFKGLADMAYNSFQLQWGWMILIIGSLLLILAGYLQNKIEWQKA